MAPAFGLEGVGGELLNGPTGLNGCQFQALAQARRDTHAEHDGFTGIRGTACVADTSVCPWSFRLRKSGRRGMWTVFLPAAERGAPLTR